MPSNKAPCRLTLRVGTMRRIGLPLASIPAIRTCSFACIRGSRRFPIIAALLSRPASTAAGTMSQSPERCQDCWCNGDITTVGDSPVRQSAKCRILCHIERSETTIMYRIILTCKGVPPALGANGARDITEEFTRKPWHQNVTCQWDGSQLILQADNDFVASGLA